MARATRRPFILLRTTDGPLRESLTIDEGRVAIVGFDRATTWQAPQGAKVIIKATNHAEVALHNLNLLGTGADLLASCIQGTDANVGLYGSTVASCPKHGIAVQNSNLQLRGARLTGNGETGVTGSYSQIVINQSKLDGNRGIAGLEYREEGTPSGYIAAPGLLVENSLFVANQGVGIRLKTSHPALFMHTTVAGNLGGAVSCFAPTHAGTPPRFLYSLLVSEDQRPVAPPCDAAASRSYLWRDAGLDAETFAPGAQSPGLDALRRCETPTDYLGVSRPVGLGCEYGALEARP